MSTETQSLTHSELEKTKRDVEAREAKLLAESSILQQSQHAASEARFVAEQEVSMARHRIAMAEKERDMKMQETLELKNTLRSTMGELQEVEEAKSQSTATERLLKNQISDLLQEVEHATTKQIQKEKQAQKYSDLVDKTEVDIKTLEGKLRFSEKEKCRAIEALYRYERLHLNSATHITQPPLRSVSPGAREAFKAENPTGVNGWFSPRDGLERDKQLQTRIQELDEIIMTQENQLMKQCAQLDDHEDTIKEQEKELQSVYDSMQKLKHGKRTGKTKEGDNSSIEQRLVQAESMVTTQAKELATVREELMDARKGRQEDTSKPTQFVQLERELEAARIKIQDLQRSIQLQKQTIMSIEEDRDDAHEEVREKVQVLHKMHQKALETKQDMQFPRYNVSPDDESDLLATKRSLQSALEKMSAQGMALKEAQGKVEELKKALREREPYKEEKWEQNLRRASPSANDSGTPLPRATSPRARSPSSSPPKRGKVNEETHLARTRMKKELDEAHRMIEKHEQIVMDMKHANKTNILAEQARSKKALKEQREDTSSYVTKLEAEARVREAKLDHLMAAQVTQLSIANDEGPVSPEKLYSPELSAAEAEIKSLQKEVSTAEDTIKSLRKTLVPISQSVEEEDESAATERFVHTTKILVEHGQQHQKRLNSYILRVNGALQHTMTLVKTEPEEIKKAQAMAAAHLHLTEASLEASNCLSRIWKNIKRAMQGDKDGLSPEV